MTTLGYVGAFRRRHKVRQNWGVAGGGGRTRTYEGLASGFTVRPLCRSGHSPHPQGTSPRGRKRPGRGRGGLRQGLCCLGARPVNWKYPARSPPIGAPRSVSCLPARPRVDPTKRKTKPHDRFTTLREPRNPRRHEPAARRSPRPVRASIFVRRPPPPVDRDDREVVVGIVNRVALGAVADFEVDNSLLRLVYKPGASPVPASKPAYMPGSSGVRPASVRRVGRPSRT